MSWCRKSDGRSSYNNDGKGLAQAKTICYTIIVANKTRMWISRTVPEPAEDSAFEDTGLCEV